MRKVVVNTTPLLVFGNIGRLDILRELYGTIQKSSHYLTKSSKTDFLSATRFIMIF